jgi:AcrR family transcriptional regulator
MKQQDCRKKLIAAATPLFAQKGLHGVNVRLLAKSAGVNLSMISYHFGGKSGLYAAVVEEQFATLRYVAQVAKMAISPWEKFRTYIYQCGICFHQGDESGFAPFTASADYGALECPKCLNNDALLFAKIAIADADAALSLSEGRQRAIRSIPEAMHG